MRAPTEIVKGLLQTEKGTRVAAHNQFLLRVATDANKVEIRQAVKALFGVDVLGVNTLLTHGKWRRLSSRWGRQSDWKKAIVTVAKGQKIEMKA